jgi:hypothetical protein
LKKQKINLARTSKILDSVWQRTCQKYEAFCEIDQEWGLEDAMTYDLESVLTAFLRAKTYVDDNGQQIFKPNPTVFTLNETNDILNCICDYNHKFKEVILVTEQEKKELNSLMGFNFT